jgi:holliday junction DNA helicase RuvB
MSGVDPAPRVTDPSLEAHRKARAGPEPERVGDARVAGEEEDLDRSLRPRRLAEFVNQQQVTGQLEIFIEAARRRDEALDHVLLAGPPGLGKTSLAHIVAAEMEAPIVGTAGPALERKADIAAFLTALEPGSVFFIDGATTRTGLLTTPLRDRFGVCHRLEHYRPDDLTQVVRRSAGIMGVEVEPEGEQAIAERSRGTPRVANRLLKRVRDFAEVRGEGVVTGPMAGEALEMLEVDGVGLDRHDRNLLSTIATKFSGGPVGLSTLAAALDEEGDTIEDVFEPYMLQQGLIKRTPRGRVVTERGFEHLGLPAPERHASLF